MKKRKFTSIGDFLRRLVYYVIKLILGERRNKEFLQWEKCKRVRMYGPEILRKFKEIANENKLMYSLTFGTLLGAYREHGFIMHDDDIDIAYDISTLSYKFLQDLQKAGFEMIDCFISDTKECVHFAYEIKNVKFDLYSFRVEGDFVELSAPNWTKSGQEISEKTGRYQISKSIFAFEGYSLNNSLCESLSIFANSKDVLEVVYGANFMTPVKNFHEAVISDKNIKVPIEESYYNLYQRSEVDKLMSDEQCYKEMFGLFL